MNRKTAQNDKTAKSDSKEVEEKASGLSADPDQRTSHSNSSFIPMKHQYQGVHTVTGSPERVMPYHSWSILVPAGYAYKMGGQYGSELLTIVSADDADFDNPDSCRFNLKVFPPFPCKTPLTKTLTNLRDYSSTKQIMDTISDLTSEAELGEWHYLSVQEDISVLMNKWEKNGSKLSIAFAIVVKGTQNAYVGSCTIKGTTLVRAQAEVLLILKSVEVHLVKNNSDTFYPCVLPDSFRLTYQQHNTIQLGKCAQIPVPDGFKASTDPSLIGPRAFSIIPSNSTDFSNAMELPVGITAMQTDDDQPFQVSLVDKVIDLIVDQLVRHGILYEGIPVSLIKLKTDGFLAICIRPYEDNSVIGRIIMWARDVLYYFSFAINCKDSADCKRYETLADAFRLMIDWANRIVIPGETIFEMCQSDTSNDGLISSTLSVALPPDALHEHYDLVTGGVYTTRRSADFIGQSIAALMKKHGEQHSDLFDLMTIKNDRYKLSETAKKIATVFRINSNLFDEHHDVEALIRLGAFSDTRMLHALRSLAWTAQQYADDNNKPLMALTYEELLSIGEFIKQRNYLNYGNDGPYKTLCDEYDWHVFYVPNTYIKSKQAKQIDLRYICGKENRGGNVITFLSSFWGADSLHSSRRSNEIISRNEETIASLNGLRKDLQDLLPLMETIRDGLLVNRDRSVKVEGPLPDALTAWCALAIAAKEPFYSEEAADTPEADAALDRPLERPTDELDIKPTKPETSKSTSKATSKTAKKTDTQANKEPTTQSTGSPKKTAPKKKPSAKKADNSVRVLETHGKTKIERSQYEFDYDTRPIEIPEGIAEIEKAAFMSACTTSVKLPRSLKIIGDGAFAICKNLESVEIQEGLEEIGSYAFTHCEKLTTVRLPSTTRYVDRFAFVENTKDSSSKITLNIPGVAARRIEKNKKDRSIPAVIAAGFMIDGTWYPSIEHYVKKIEAAEKDTRTPDKGNENKADQSDNNHMNFSPLELKNILDDEKYKGYHKVQGSGEYVSPDRNWVIRIPAGLSYTMDPAEVARTILGDRHLLQADNDKFALFEAEGYLASFGVTVLPYCFSYSKLSSPFHRLDTSSALEEALKIVNNTYESFRKFKQTRDVLVLIKDSDRDEDSIVIEFRILCSDSDMITTGRIGMQGPQNKLKEWEPMAFHMLESIERLPFQSDERYDDEALNSSLLEPSNYDDSGSPSSEKIEDEGFEIDDDVLTQYTGDATHVTVPDGITRIGDDAFLGKTLIQTVVLPDSVKVIGESAFFDCDNLETINLPEGLTEIKSDAFFHCDSLTYLDIPCTVNTIGGDAFLFCNHIKRIRIPSTLTDIGNGAFKYCSGLETVIVYGGRSSSAALEATKEHFTDDVNVIWESDEQFTAKKQPSGERTSSAGTRDAKERTISSAKKPSTVQFDDAISFELREGYSIAKNEGEEEHTISNGWAGASFGYMSIMEKKRIEMLSGERPLEAVHRLKVNKGNWIKWSESPEVELHYRIDGEFMISLILYISEEDSSDLPMLAINFQRDDNDREWNLLHFDLLIDIIRMIRVNGKKIPDKHLTGERLYTILKPYLVTANDDENQIILPEMSEITEDKDIDLIRKACTELGCWTIGTTLTKCTNDAIEEIDIPRGITQIFVEAFLGCKQLKRVNIPDTVKAIQKGAFQECTSLEDIVIPNSVETLWIRAFQDCTSLKHVTLSDSLKTLKDSLFKNCTNLTHVVIPDSITSIGCLAFYNCSSLQELDVPASIKRIGAGAFLNCEKLTQVFIHGSDVHIEDKAFPVHTKLLNCCAENNKYATGSIVTATTSGEINSSSTVTRKRRAQVQKPSDPQESFNTTASKIEQTADRPLTAEEKTAIREAQGILADMQSQMRSTTSALETHKENLRKQEEEKQRHMEEAKKKGKSSRDEVDMLAVLLIEEAHGQLNRDEDNFVELFAEDFGAYDAKQLIRLRRKVLPTIHDRSVIEAAKADMLTRTVEDRFSISTANYFNVSTDWDFDSKGTAAIEATKQWYKPEEMPELRKCLEEHKEKTRQSVNSQLTAFRNEWSDFRGLRSDLHITISTDSEPVQAKNNLFHVKMGRDLDVRISIINPVLGYISIPVMNIFASCWKVSPEDIWNAALQNSIEDSRGQSSSSRNDAIAAKTKALSQIKPRSSTTLSSAANTNTTPRFANTQSLPKANAQTNPNAKRIKELEESIAALQREADSIEGVFGFVKRNKIKKEIEAQRRELESLKR